MLVLSCGLGCIRGSVIYNPAIVVAIKQCQDIVINVNNAGTLFKFTFGTNKSVWATLNTHTQSVTSPLTHLYKGRDITRVR